MSAKNGPKPRRFSRRDIETLVEEEAGRDDRGAPIMKRKAKNASFRWDVAPITMLHYCGFCKRDDQSLYVGAGTTPKGAARNLLEGLTSKGFSAAAIKRSGAFLAAMKKLPKADFADARFLLVFVCDN